MPKSIVKPMNSSKNKLNSEKILIFHFNPNVHLVLVWIAQKYACVSFMWPHGHYSWDPQLGKNTNLTLKLGPIALFTHLKIISLQCFQFQFSISTKISSIQTDP